MRYALPFARKARSARAPWTRGCAPIVFAPLGISARFPMTDHREHVVGRSIAAACFAHGRLELAAAAAIMLPKLHARSARTLQRCGALRCDVLRRARAHVRAAYRCCGQPGARAWRCRRVGRHLRRRPPPKTERTMETLPAFAIEFNRRGKRSFSSCAPTLSRSRPRRAAERRSRIDRWSLASDSASRTLEARVRSPTRARRSRWCRLGPRRACTLQPMAMLTT